VNIDDLGCAARNNPDEASIAPNFNPAPHPRTAEQSSREGFGL